MITPEERAELTREITEHILLLLPGVISHLINNVSTMKGLVNQFYEKNKDLVPHKAVVGTVIEQLEAKYPGKPISEIMELAVPQVKQLLSQQNRVSSAPRMGVQQLDKVLGEL